MQTRARSCTFCFCDVANAREEALVVSIAHRLSPKDQAVIVAAYVAAEEDARSIEPALVEKERACAGALSGLSHCGARTRGVSWNGAAHQASFPYMNGSLTDSLRSSQKATNYFREQSHIFLRGTRAAS